MKVALYDDDDDIAGTDSDACMSKSRSGCGLIANVHNNITINQSEGFFLIILVLAYLYRI